MGLFDWFRRPPPPPDPHRDLREQIERRTLELQNKLLEAQVAGPNWIGNVVDPYEPLFDDPGFWLPLYAGDRLPPTLDKTNRGELLPVYITWYGLKVVRDISRRICLFNEFAINALENRVSYTCGRGFQYKVIPKDGKDTADVIYLGKLAQRWIDMFTSGQCWNELEQEIIRRCDRDGECFVRFFHVGHGHTEVRIIEPEWIRSPDERDWETYGIVNEPRDVADVLGYWVIEDPPYSAPTFVPAEEILHIKGHLAHDSTTKRGLPTLFPVRKNLVRVEKLLQNMSTLATVQATFAMIRKWKQYSVSQIQGFQQQNADFNWTDPYSGQNRFSQGYMPGTIIDYPENVEVEFPSSTVNAGALVACIQAELRAVAAAIQMPEFLLTADACVSDTHQLRTMDGWKTVHELKEGEKVGTINPATGELEWQVPTAYYGHPFDGELVTVKGKSIDHRVTPNHLLWLGRNRGSYKGVPYGVEWKKERADALEDGRCSFLIQNTFLDSTLPKKVSETTSAPGLGEIPTELWMKFLGIYLGDGSIQTQGNVTCTTKRVAVGGITKERKIRQYGPVLETLGFERCLSGGRVSWWLDNAELREWIADNIGRYSEEKRLPRIEASIQSFEWLWEGLLWSDGHIEKDAKSYRCYSTTSRELADSIQWMLLRIGRRSSIATCPPGELGTLPVYKVHCSDGSRPIQMRTDLTVGRERYKGLVWCVTVPNGLLVWRNNDKVTISSNSNNNYASIQITESPFVKAMERCQAFFARRFGDGASVKIKNTGAMWRVLANAVDYGGLPREVLTDCELQVEGPSLIGREKAQETQRLAVLTQAGIISRSTWTKLEGFDREQEDKQINQELQKDLAKQQLLQQAQMAAQQQQMLQQQQATQLQQMQAAGLGMMPGAGVDPQQLAQQPLDQQELTGMGGVPALPSENGAELLGAESVQEGKIVNGRNVVNALIRKSKLDQDAIVVVEWLLDEPTARVRYGGIRYKLGVLMEAGFSGGVIDVDTQKQYTLVNGMESQLDKSRLVFDHFKHRWVRPAHDQAAADGVSHASQRQGAALSRPFEMPPAPRGKPGERKPGGFSATGQTVTEMGDLGEQITRQLGLRSILPRGKRQGPFDAELDHTGWVYEIKLLTTHAAEYKTKLRRADAQAKLDFAKKHGLTPATMMIILDPERKKAFVYWRVGIGSWNLTPGTAKEWTFAGALKV